MTAMPPMLGPGQMPDGPGMSMPPADPLGMGAAVGAAVHRPRKRAGKKARKKHAKRARRKK